MNAKLLGSGVSALILIFVLIGFVCAIGFTWSRTPMEIDGVKVEGFAEEHMLMDASVIIGAIILCGFVLLGLSNLLMVSDRTDGAWKSLAQMREKQSPAQIMQMSFIGAVLVLAGTFGYPVLYGDAKLKDGWTYTAVVGAILAVLVVVRWVLGRIKPASAAAS